MQWLLIIMGTFLIDQITKHFALDITTPVEIMPFLNFVYVQNTGMSFGLLQHIPFLITCTSFIITGFVIYLLFKTPSPFERFCYSLILGGAFGNLFDRLYRGYVIDFIDIHCHTIHFWIFNIADSAIVIAVMVLMYYKYKTQAT